MPVTLRARVAQRTCRAGYDQEGWPVALFQRTAALVPAYSHYLLEHGIEPEIVRSLNDLATVPPITKGNYLTHYPLPELMRQGEITGGTVVSTSSGSSGEPFYWFRGEESQAEAVHFYDHIFSDIFGSRTRSTLLIVGFAMGNWIGGTYTLQGATALPALGHKLVTLSPGLAKAEIVHALKEISPHFDQTVIAAYPPFAKDVIDEACRTGLDLARLDLKVLCAGEQFSEEWRNYLLERIQSTDANRVISMYGTAEAGIMGHETPLSIYIRRKAAGHEELSQALFGEKGTLPTVVQYDPALRYVEEADGYLLFTVDTTIPLIRYNIQDTGRVLPASQALAVLKQFGITVPRELRRWSHLPFIFLFGRSDVATTFYGLNIYPENIKAGLEHPNLIHLLSGKFVLETRFDPGTQEPTLHLLVELQADIEAESALISEISKNVVAALRLRNSEYNRLCEVMGELAFPILTCAQKGSAEFVVRTKHRWSRRTP